MGIKNPDKTISISVFDLLKTGPSSSHTISPMKAGFDFALRVKNLSPNYSVKRQRSPCSFVWNFVCNRERTRY